MPKSPILVTGGKDGRVLVYDVTEYAEPPQDAPFIPYFAAPAAVAPNPDLRDEVTALCWSPVDTKLLYAAHASGEQCPAVLSSLLRMGSSSGCLRRGVGLWYHTQ
jgi:hypothetical protein